MLIRVALMSTLVGLWPGLTRGQWGGPGVKAGRRKERRKVEEGGEGDRVACQARARRKKENGVRRW